MRRTQSSVDKQIFVLSLLVNICCIVMDPRLKTQKQVLGKVAKASDMMASKLLTEYSVSSSEGAHGISILLNSWVEIRGSVPK